MPAQDLPPPLYLTVPWPPSFNRIWKPYRKRIVLAKRAHLYKAALRRALPTGRVAPPLTGRLLVWMNLHPPASLKEPWDIANREKLLCDCLTRENVWADDEQIDGLVMLRCAPDKKGRIDIVIHTIAPGGAPITPRL